MSITIRTDFDTHAPNTVSETTTTSPFVATELLLTTPGAHTWNYLTGADPKGDVTTHQFSTPDSTTGAVYETGTLYYKASSTLLKNVQTTYGTPVSTKFQGAVNYFPVARTTTLDNGQVTKDAYTILVLPSTMCFSETPIPPTTARSPAPRSMITAMALLVRCSATPTRAMSGGAQIEPRQLLEQQSA